ncbi:endonuclease/exonuclease/phosphatase family protein [Roseomonas sp. AR75]|uniref:endonuclease/exonuclease/phosphatase family protein n=1 Tax=Roseomonas sp. AR75 TaxID=2562311 RepID=UPI0010BFAAC9|nr:endonuclease/exonuclease/phosphatase family protein [Roseomonas sp. AR75]
MRRIAFLLLLLMLATPFAPPARAAQEIKLATWNIAWLTLKPAGHPDLPRDLRTRSTEDLRLLRGYAVRLNADVIALQEIDSVEAAERIFDPATYAIHLTSESDTQRPGFAVRRSLRVRRNPDLAELDIRAGARRSLRRGADITVEGPGGEALRLLSVHLDAGCRDDPLDRDLSRDCEGLARQARILARWAQARRDEGVGFAILGDFNRVMGRDDDFLRIVAEGQPILRPTAGFSTPCWADARGGRPFIDHILLGGPARNWFVANSMSVMAYAERDRSFRERLSDHCPVSVRLRLP